MQFNISESADGHSVAFVIFADGSSVVVPDTHPAWPQLVKALKADASEDRIKVLTDTRVAYSRYAGLSKRFKLVRDKLFFDGEAAREAVAKQFLRMARDGAYEERGAAEDPAVAVDQEPPVRRPAKPRAPKLEPTSPDVLARFMDKLAANPSENSRAAAWRWLETHDFTITPEGDVIGYKGISSERKSTSAGRAYVNGTLVNGYIPNPEGAVVHMTRSWVDDNTHASCSTGLHVGTFSYAQSFGSQVITVLIDPADIVSVPHDGGGQKMRVCRYRVLDVVTAPLPKPVLAIA